MCSLTGRILDICKVSGNTVDYLWSYRNSDPAPSCLEREVTALLCLDADDTVKLRLERERQ